MKSVKLRGLEAALSAVLFLIFLLEQWSKVLSKKIDELGREIIIRHEALESASEIVIQKMDLERSHYLVSVVIRWFEKIEEAIEQSMSRRSLAAT